MPTDLLPALSRHPFLEGIPVETLALMVGCTKNHRFEPGELLAQAGAEANSFFLLRQGHVAICARGPSQSLTVHTAGPGDLVGWSWLVAPYRYRFDARAVEPTVAFEVHGECLRDKFDEHPELGHRLLLKVSTVLGERVDDLQLRLLDVYQANGRG